MAEIEPKYAEKLKNQHYELVGRHSAVEVCHFTKQALRGKGACYKNTFYGILSHRCVQMSPTANWCDSRCLHCWRSNAFFQDKTMDDDVDDPELVVEGSIQAQLKKLTGFGGNPDVSEKRLKEAQDPKHMAISLTGEPTLYPKLAGLIQVLRNKNMSSFLVTHGLHPEVLQQLKDDAALPTQLYLSMEGPTKESHKKLDVPLLDDAWERLNNTIDLFPKLPCRKVVRITLLKGLNDNFVNEFAEIMKRAQPHFIEVKAYTYIGQSRVRLKQENTPTHADVSEFAEKLAKELGYQVMSEKQNSKVVLLAAEDYPWRVMDFTKSIKEIESTPPFKGSGFIYDVEKVEPTKQTSTQNQQAIPERRLVHLKSN